MTRVDASPDFLANALLRSPESVALYFLDEAYTFRVVDELASTFASGLLQYGLAPGDRFALLSPNHPVHMTAQLAACRSGATLVPLNVRLTPGELGYIISDADVGLLVAHEDCEELVEGLLERSPQLTVWWVKRNDPHVGRVASGSFPTFAPLDPEAIATILYTSGTTGRPKGAKISNRAHDARILAYAQGSSLRRGGVTLQVLPMFHIAATYVFASVYLGGTSVILEAYDPQAVADTIERYGVTHTCLVPTMITDVVENCDHSKFATLETLLYGASPIDAGDLRRARAALGCDFVNSFGQTETGPVTFMLGEDHDPDDPLRLTAAGKAALAHEVKVLDDGGAVAPPGVVGEIVVRGPQVMSGYLGLPEATSEALADGWLHTGDLGRIDDENYLFVTDRLKDMVISGGENVYPREVEAVLVEHPGVREVAVIGVPHPRYVETLHAIVVPEGGPTEEADLVEFCRAELAGYKVPRSWSYTDELPRTATGKVIKTILRDDWLEQNTSGSG
ncbi:MAG: class I adenylate-forming enzyme family protein [Microthrixaceae bacterium]